MEHPTTANTPFMLRNDEGKTTWFSDGLLTLKLAGEQSGGRWTVLEATFPAGQQRVLHVHHGEDEAWYVLEGNVTFTCGERTFEATPGSFVFGPKNIPHGLTVAKDGPARMLVFASPAGFEKYIEELGEPARERTLPRPQQGDPARTSRIATKYQIELMP